MEATQKDQSCDARGEAVDSDEVNAGAQYDMPDDQESAELLRTIASMHSCAKYSLGELDAEERAASARHLDVLFLRAVDDLRMAVGQREIDAFKAGAAYTHRELAPILSEIAKAHVTLRGAIRIGKRTVKLAPIADVTKAFDALAATIASLRAALEVSEMSIELFNDARMTLFSAMHTLTCIKTRIAHVLGDEEANDFSFAIEGVVMLLKKAEDEYEAAEIAERAAAREPEPTVVAVDHAPRAEVIDLFERLKQSIAKGEHPKGGAE